LKSSPWLASYQLPLDEAKFRLRVEVPAVECLFPHKSRVANCEALTKSLRAVFLCDDQVKTLMEFILGIAEEHARTHYADDHAILRGIYSPNPWGYEYVPAILLTGLAGVGKSELLLALRRFVGGPRVADLPGHSNIPHIPIGLASARAGQGLNAILERMILEAAGGSGEQVKSKVKSEDDLIAMVRRLTRRSGTCLLLVDELQFITNSADANTRVTALLLRLQSIGTRVVYVANYSLGHRLRERRQEDRQRLISSPLHLDPLDLGCKHFTSLLNEYSKVAPDDLRLTEGDLPELIHQYTFGVKRAIIELTAKAWLRAKGARGSRAVVNADDVRKAHQSEEYASYREDVEALWKARMGSDKVRTDLKSPFRSESQICSVSQATEAIEGFERRLRERHLDGFMTAQEREASAVLARGQSERGDQRREKVVALRAASSTPRSLLEASRILNSRTARKGDGE